ncbi:MAG: hypothetical protein HFACDABA_02296 [Anaerolineales bacterium]|nr:hypothetical protein [Anaerolineales bacterium]
MTVLLAAFYVVQRPDILQIPGGLANLSLTIFIPAWMALLSAAIGSRILPQADAIERLTLGTALGLCLFGLSGFGLAMAGLAKPIVLLTILFLSSAYFLWRGMLQQTREDLRQYWKEMRASIANIPTWIPACAALLLCLTFLLGLAPPVEDFDALFYHLAVPALWLKQGTSAAFAPMPHYWYPQIVEGMFLWPMALGSDTAPHLIHLLWLTLSMTLLWHWTRQLAGNAPAWNAVLLLLCMPSLSWLGAWAYTDYALTFAALAASYSLWKWKTNHGSRWLTLAALMAGLAVSVKYTGFIVPLAGVLFILVFARDWRKAFHFGIICVIASSPWYLRNWIGTGNPLFPFLFGGAGWDTFLAQAYAAPGSGFGWNISSLLTLPLTATLGIRDANFFDGRIGPLFLILSPLAVWSFWNARKASAGQKTAVQAIGLLVLVGGSFWTMGVIGSAHLFQTRLLFPILIPLTIPCALGLEMLARFDMPKFKVSFVFRAMLFLVVMINLVNLGLQITARNPLAVALGITSRQEYIAKRQPGYANALALVHHAPRGAQIYFLFEPRSYGMDAHVQPDSINMNFIHAIWQYKMPKAALAAWRSDGYTHVLISNTGADFVLQNTYTVIPFNREILSQLELLLRLIETSADGGYSLYQIP